MPAIGRILRRGAPVALLLALAAAALSSPVAGAAEPLPVGSAEGVRAAQGRGGLVLRFTPAAAGLYRQIAGKRVEVACTSEGPSTGLGFTVGSEDSTTLRAPRRRAPLRVGIAMRGVDYCRLWRAPRPGRRGSSPEETARDLIVSIPLTRDGAARLDEQSKARDVISMMVLAEALAERGGGKNRALRFLTPPALLAALRELGDPGAPVVVLDGPDATPPAGCVGYWSDGDRQVEISAVTALGRRLYVYLGPDEALRTNIVRYLFDDEP